MSDASSNYRQYLDPRVLARVGALELRARLIVEGLLTGQHRSPYQGASVEFAQHRPYVHGDDIRHVDDYGSSVRRRHYLFHLCPFHHVTSPTH